MARPPTADGLYLTAMAERHLAQVDALRQQLLGEASNPGFLQAALRAENQQHIVAVARVEPARAGPASSPATGSVTSSQHTILGYAAAMSSGEESELIAIAVQPDHQNRGIASRLLAELFRRAAQRGVRAFGLDVRLSNSRAQALYRRFGFAPVAVRRDYYPPSAVGPREHALIMWSPDISSPEVLRQLDKVAAGF